MDQRFQWKNKQIREQVAVLNGEASPTLLLKNARFLHSVLRTWMVANIWILRDRIIYVGEELPQTMENCEVIDCTGMTLVPGYIEPHVHPFQLYNPIEFSRFAMQTGTTTLICDNLLFFLHLTKKKAFSLLSELKKSPATMYWWGRYDSQTEMLGEEKLFTNEKVKSWLKHNLVVQGGELTGWPQLLHGDDLMLYWIQETKLLGKKVEGHLPGASSKTLAKMKLLGVDSDHEAMTGEEVYRRLLHGYNVALRHSSIRPDLPNILQQLHELGITNYDSIMLTTDGSTPAFCEHGLSDFLVRIALENGVPAIDAYHMVSYNIARHFNMTAYHGMIATGQIANINFLTSEEDPTPVSVLAKGTWVKKDNKNVEPTLEISWEKYDLGPMKLDWEIQKSDLQFSMPFGIEMVNDVITKPYTITVDVAQDYLPQNHDESFLTLLDRHGKWRLNTKVKGFAKTLSGFASSYSCTGDIILIGKVKNDMILAFKRMKEIGGGIVIAENGKIIYEVPLPLAGMMSDQPIDVLKDQDEKLKEHLRERGYTFSDPIYSLLFFSATHLPYIRITQKGMYDVMNKIVLFPTLMR